MISLSSLKRNLSRFATESSYTSIYNFITKLSFRSSPCTSPPISASSLVKDSTAIADALNFAESLGSSALGSSIHNLIFKLGLLNDVYPQNNLIKMYMNCGVYMDAGKMFDEMPNRNLVSWTLMISGANRNGVYGWALESFVGMIRTGFLPNEFALGSIMKTCTSMGARELGLCIHCFAVKIGMVKNSFVGSSILHMYAKCGAIEAAEWMFESLDGCDRGCWNAMIGGYAQCGYGLEAVSTVSLMHSEGVLMDEFTFINALNGCSIMGDLDFGSQIHGLIVRGGFHLRVSLMNSLMDMYFKTGTKDLALKLFDTMQNKDAVSWNTALVGSSQDADANEVVCLFNRYMHTDLKPNHITFSILFRLCGDILELDLGLQLYGLAFHLGLHEEPQVSTHLIYMLCRCGAKEMARSIFDSLPSRTIQNWNEMINGYNWSCDEEALKLFATFWGSNFEADECTLSCALEACFKSENTQAVRQVHGIIVKYGFTSSGYLCSSLINGYAKSGFLADSYLFFRGIEKMDIASWSALISALVNQGYYLEAVRFLNSLKEHGQDADEFILGSVLKACASISSLNLTKSVHAQVFRRGFVTNEFVTSAVVDAYGKSGDIKSATISFQQSCKFADVALYNTMIMAYANHGLVMEALEVYEGMKTANLQPSQSTFVSVLSACNYMGLVDLGRRLFRSITLDYRMKPSADNYGCLVDMLSRNGFLQEAKCVIEEMPFPAWPGIWRSFLNGCTIHGDRELGEFAAKKLFNLSPENNAAYLLMSKIYSADGNWEDAAKVRKEMVDKEIKKDLGCSWIDI